MAATKSPSRLPFTENAAGEILSFRVPIPPSFNAAYRAVQGKILKTSAYRKYEMAFPGEIQKYGDLTSAPENFFDNQSGYEIYMRVFFDKIYKKIQTDTLYLRIDADRRVTILLDCIESALGIRDETYRRIVVDKETDPNDPRVEISIIRRTR